MQFSARSSWRAAPGGIEIRAFEIPATRTSCRGGSFAKTTPIRVRSVVAVPLGV
jgi:hypothetical protein